MNELTVSAPGRICLLGEHQDYLGLSILAGAINLRLTISGKPRRDKLMRIKLPDIGETEEFFLNEEIPYIKPRDYFRSTVNILRRKGYVISRGWDCLVRGTIPINSGTASSSALVVAWVKFLLEAAGYHEVSHPADIAELAFLAEVAEFKESGGKMDHFSSAFGGVMFISFGKNFHYQQMKNPLSEFVIADSRQRKDTTGILAFIKSNVLQGVSQLRQHLPGFNLLSPLSPKVKEKIDGLEPDLKRLLLGTLKTRDLTLQGKRLFEIEPFSDKKFGELLSAQHQILRDYLKISTPKIETMLESAMKAGALGGKINGSGGGGCIFVYCPGKSEEVAAALENQGFNPLTIKIDEGLKKEYSGRHS